jgi:GDP-4-dehydro-6-deoxy-D-mannose reductase
LLSLSTVDVRVEQDPARLRPADVPRIVCDPRSFQALTGWQATIPLEQSLADILNDWRARIRA